MRPEAILPLSVTPQSLANDVKPIPVQALTLEELDPTKRSFNEQVAAGLAESIAAEGLLTPPIVEDLSNGQYKVLAGATGYTPATRS